MIISPTPAPPSTMAIALRNYVIGNGVVYQGVSLNLMPTSILSTNCSICDSVLLV